jgi:hypothetical protein
MIRNLAIGFAPLAGAGNGGPSIVLSGAEDATSMSWGLDHVGEIMDRTGGGLGSTMLATLQTHDSAGSVLNLMWGKFRALWHWYEFPNNENFYYGQLVAPVLEWMPVTWVVIAPLGVIGLVLGATRWRVAGPLFVLVICNIALLVMFFVLSRLRLPLAGALTPFAAMTVAKVAQWCLAQRWREACLVVLTTGALAIWMNPALPRGLPKIRVGDFVTGFAVHWLPQLQRAERAKDVPAIETIFAEALAIQDSLVGDLGTKRPAASEAEADIALSFEELYTQHARALRALGRDSEAVADEQRAAELRAAAQRPAR